MRTPKHESFAATNPRGPAKVSSTEDDRKRRWPPLFYNQAKLDLIRNPGHENRKRTSLSSKNRKIERNYACVPLCFHARAALPACEYA